MDTEKIDALAKRVELFQGLTHEEIGKIFSKGMTMRVTKGEAVFNKGAVGSQMYVVLGGTLGVFDGKEQLATLRFGEMFGEMALTTNEPRSASVVALEDSQVFVLTESLFERLLTKRVSIRLLMNIIRTLSRRLKDANLRKQG